MTQHVNLKIIFSYKFIKMFLLNTKKKVFRKLKLIFYEHLKLDIVYQ